MRAQVQAGAVLKIARLLLAVAVAGSSFAAPAWPADRDGVIEGCGILFPEGFDLNTVGELHGKVGPLTRPSRGPVRFQLDTGRDSYTVLTTPGWYWNDLKIELPEGTEVAVRGSKTVGTDGKLYMVAQELRVVADGRVVTLRDRTGTALWAGSRGSGQGGGRMRMGGMGAGGPGGAGRGGRR